MYINGERTFGGFCRPFTLWESMLLAVCWYFIVVGHSWILMIFYESLCAVVEPGLKNAFCLTEMGWDRIYYWYWCCKWKCHLLNDFWINQYFQFFNFLVFLSHVCICNPCESHTAGMSLDRIEQYFEAGIYFCCSHVWQFCLRIVTDENFSCIVNISFPCNYCGEIKCVSFLFVIYCTKL